MIQLIDSSSCVDNFLATLWADLKKTTDSDRFISVDTEFIRENLDSPLLCLVQIATSEHLFVIDTLAVDTFSLASIFGDAGVLKVFHAADQDIEILSSMGIVVKNFHDTQLYEMLLDTRERISYQSIVLKYTGQKLAKYCSLSDWKQRPLSQKQIIYSSEDVFYLRDVYKKQKQELVMLGRDGWLQDELDQIAESAALATINKDVAEKFDLFDTLSKWVKDNSAKSVVAKDILKKICRKRNDYIIKLRNSRLVKNDVFAKFLVFAENALKSASQEKLYRPNYELMHLLKAILMINSKRYNIAASLIATTFDLEKIVAGDKNMKCFRHWRKHVFGNDVNVFLDGRLKICMKNNEITLEKE
jgi:ribonuclease D